MTPIKIGQVWKHDRFGMTVSIEGIDINNMVSYVIKSQDFTYNFLDHAATLGDQFARQGWELKIKPLDKAFKELDKKICSHRNIREDRFFSAMVYKTCKDCGQALN